jgi:hypothetical protein
MLFPQAIYLDVMKAAKLERSVKAVKAQPIPS